MFEIFQPIKCVPIISFSSLAQLYVKKFKCFEIFK